MRITQQAPPTDAMTVTMVMPGDFCTFLPGEFSLGGAVACGGPNSLAPTNCKIDAEFN